MKTYQVPVTYAWYATEYAARRGLEDALAHGEVRSIDRPWIKKAEPGSAAAKRGLPYVLMYWATTF